MKMILDVDHRKLLKLRNKKLIASDEDPRFSIFQAKKCIENKKMLNVYVDNIRQKKLDQRDLKLLNLTGLNEIINILKAKEVFHINLKKKKEEPPEMFTDGVNFQDLLDVVNDAPVNHNINIVVFICF